MRELLNAREVAGILGVSYRTVLNYIDDKRLPAFKAKGFRRGDTSPWRVRRCDLETFMGSDDGANNTEPSDEARRDS